MQKLQEFTLLFRSVKSFQENDSSQNSAFMQRNELLECRRMHALFKWIKNRTEQKTKPKNKAPNPNDALWVCKTQRTLVLADNAEAMGAAQGNVFL